MHTQETDYGYPVLFEDWIYGSEYRIIATEPAIILPVPLNIPTVEQLACAPFSRRHKETRALSPVLI